MLNFKRKNIFIFSKGGLLTLKDEYFEEVKPGLSNFADKPRHVSNLIFFCKQEKYSIFLFLIC